MQPSAIQVVGQADRAEVLMDPLRIRIIEAAAAPVSAAGIARALDETPQKINYHVGRLEAHGYLRKVRERRVRNAVEKLYVATARRYQVSSRVLGALAPDPEAEDPGERLLAAQGQASDELGSWMGAGGAGTDAVMVEAEFRLETEEQRQLFVRALRELVLAVVGKYTAPADPAGDGLSYRMVLGCHPVVGPEGVRTLEPALPAESVADRRGSPE